jgi:hypothetical protein
MRQRFILASLVIITTVGVSSGVSAQQQGVGLNLPISGFGDLGATFSGTLRINGFDVQGNTVAATGVASGVLGDASGTRRNIVTRLSIPVDLTGSLARRNSDATLANASCDTLHLEFGTFVTRVLDSTLVLDPTAIDITTTGESVTTAAAQTSRQTLPVSSFDARFPTGITSTQTGATVMQTPGGTSIFGSTVPGTVMTVGSQIAGAVTPVVTPQVTQPADLAPLLCSASRLRDSASDRTQLVQLLNRVIAAIG